MSIKASFDPNAKAFGVSREARVTARKSVTMPFAPSQDPYVVGVPVPTLDVELDKGLRGWSDFDVKIDAAGEHRSRQSIIEDEQRFEEITAGETIIRKAPRKDVRVVSRTGPNAHFKQMQARAAKAR